MYKRMPEPRMLCLQNWYHNFESWEKKPVWNPIILSEILSYSIQVYPSFNITRVQISRLMHPSSRSRKPCRHVVETSEPSEATDIHKALPINGHHSESFRIELNRAVSETFCSSDDIWRRFPWCQWRDFFARRWPTPNQTWTSVAVEGFDTGRGCYWNLLKCRTTIVGYLLNRNPLPFGYLSHIPIKFHLWTFSEFPQRQKGGVKHHKTTSYRLELCELRRKMAMPPAIAELDVGGSCYIPMYRKHW